MPGGGPGGPAGPAGPATPSSGTPTTGAGPAISEEANWQVWWELNKDPFVQQGTTEVTGPTTGSDDFYLGRRRKEVRVDVLQPTDLDLIDRVVPALAALMNRERNRDVQSACLVALGKIGRDGPGIELQKLLAERIARDDQEVRETAVLALGIAGQPKAMSLLLSLLEDDAEGKRLCEREHVGDRTRAFAAYSLGLLARRTSDLAHKQFAHDALLAILNDKELKNRDLRVAAVSGLGLLCDPQQAVGKRLAWVTVDELLEWYQRDLGRSDEAIQAHAPVAIGRLLGRGTTQLHQRCKQHFSLTLNAATGSAGKDRSNPILQSAALALGMLSSPAEGNAEDAAFSRALQIHFEKGTDRLARYFAVMALGRIGGAANRTWLFNAYRRSNKTTERPWICLSLGLIAAVGAAKGEVDTDFASLLLDDLQAEQKPDLKAAMAVSLGMTQYVAAVPTMKKLLLDSEHDEMLAGYFCIGLAMLGDKTVAPTLGEILERSQRRPFLLQQAAVGLGRLGDPTANDRLLAMMKKSESVAVLAAIANAIGQIGDRRAIDPLLEMTRNEEVTRLARAFVAAALGGVCDRSPLPWNMPLGRDSNYAAPVDTLSNGATGVLDIL